MFTYHSRPKQCTWLIILLFYLFNFQQDRGKQCNFPKRQDLISVIAAKMQTYHDDSILRFGILLHPDHPPRKSRPYTLKIIHTFVRFWTLLWNKKNKGGGPLPKRNI